MCSVGQGSVGQGSGGDKDSAEASQEQIEAIAV